MPLVTTHSLADETVDFIKNLAVTDSNNAKYN